MLKRVNCGGRRRERRLDLSIYFLVAGSLVTWGLGWVVLFLGSFDSDGPSGYVTIGSIANYCVLGAIASCVGRGRGRGMFAVCAHLGLIVGGIVDGTGWGVFLCGVMALPFGVAWFRLLDEPERERRVESCLASSPGENIFYS